MDVNVAAKEDEMKKSRVTHSQLIGPCRASPSVPRPSVRDATEACKASLLPAVSSSFARDKAKSGFRFREHQDLLSANVT